MATYREVWFFLADTPGAAAWQVGEEFWPEAAKVGLAHGGPTRGTAIALRLLGRMRRAGHALKKTDGAHPSRWYAHPDGPP